MNHLFNIRPVGGGKEPNFVVSAWLKSFKKSKHAGVLPNHKYTPYYKEVIDLLLKRGMKILVLANKQDDSQLLGFIAYEETLNSQPVVHYIYIKDVYWNKGLATLLLRAASVKPGVPFFYTFKTYHSRFLKDGYHNPGLARRKNLEPVYEVPTKVYRVQHGRSVVAPNKSNLECGTRRSPEESNA